jgi:hypothetical protein
MTSQNIEVINWQVRRRESHTYVVAALKEGTLVVGPAGIQVAGRLVKSGTVAINVRAGRGGAPAAPGPDAQAAPPGDDVRAQGSVFMHATATPPKVYQGQEVVAVWSLYTQSDVLGFQPVKQPTTDHFWSEDLQTPQRLEFERRMAGNRLYYAAVLARRALFPQKVGKLSVGPMEAQVRTIDQFASPAVTLRSDVLTVEVLPLPAAGRPPGFELSNVGQYDIFASLDRGTVKAGDAVTLKVVVRGAGNVGNVKLPGLGALAGFKVYEPKVTDRLERDGTIRGEKVVEYLLLPTRTGALRIPPIDLDYFDPKSVTYKRASTAPLALTVTGQMPASLDRPDPTRNVLGPNIRPPRPATSISHRVVARPLRSPVFWAFFALPLAALIVLGGAERLRARLTRETPSSLRRAAARRTAAHLKAAAQHRRRGDAGGFFGAIAAALRTQLDQRLEIRTEGLTRPELEERLASGGASEELVSEVVRELDNCDFARFAPSASGAQQMEEALGRARRLLDRLARVRARTGEGA